MGVRLCPPSTPLPFLPPLPYPPFLSRTSCSVLSPPLPTLEVGPLNPAKGSVSSPSGVWGKAAAEIEFGAF